MRYLLLNKPAGVVSACRDEKDTTVLDLLPPEERVGLFPIGRLDKYTEGLLLLTDDGKLCRQLLRPECRTEKGYFFWALGRLTEADCRQVAQGLYLPKGGLQCRPARLELGEVRPLASLTVPPMPRRHPLPDAVPAAAVQSGRLWLTEGKRHQVKRMLEALGCPILYLQRFHFAGLTLEGGLAPGAFRPLTGAEVAVLKEKEEQALTVRAD